MNKIIILLSTLSIVQCIFDIQYSDDVQNEFSGYFNYTLNESTRMNRLSLNAQRNNETIFLIEYKFGNIPIIDIRLYYYTIENFTHHVTDNGVFFPKRSINDILRFIYSTSNYECYLTDIGFLHLNNIVIDDQIYLNIKMQHIIYRDTKFRGIVLTPLEVRTLTSTLNALDWS